MKIETVKTAKDNKTNNLTGGLTMKKTLFVVFLAVMALMLVSTTSFAKVTGTCSSCHTMHASQDGTATNTPSAYLLKANCVACHTSDALLGGAVARGAKVDNTSGSAAGTFYTVGAASTENQSHQHNVAGLAALDGAFSSRNVPGGSIAYTTQVTCSGTGTTGCHGSGFHHTDTMYRGLSGIEGKGVTDREYSGVGGNGATADNHNVYSANTTTGISAFCAKCHGGFHGTDDTGTASPFTRHPTDNTIIGINGTLVADYNLTPYAFAGGEYTANTTTAAYASSSTGARVACISCHRSHGSGQPDLLRFAMSSAGVGGDTGCLNCHSKQR